MAEPTPQDQIDAPAALSAKAVPRLSQRGKWLLIAAFVSLLCWALIVLWVAGMLSS